ncbi:MAG: hypothetical protein MZV64_60015 [Ignavibacteriales bacterium]|nr:hypothetical protein [Ignavibacteriales bacterium]
MSARCPVFNIWHTARAGGQPVPRHQRQHHPEHVVGPRHRRQNGTHAKTPRCHRAQLTASEALRLGLIALRAWASAGRSRWTRSTA